MATYSVNTSSTTEAISYNISGTPSYFEDILYKLRDNKTKNITPHDLRDSMISLWDDVVFKQTTISGTTSEYIGIDSGNSQDKDLKRKILWGKRSFSGTNDFDESYSIMNLNSNLLSNDYDQFFWNTKSDSESQIFTKLQFISGKGVASESLGSTTDIEQLFQFGIDNTIQSGVGISLIYSDKRLMPYIQSSVITGVSNSLSLEFLNPLGDINISSDSGTVSVSNLSFPTYNDSLSTIGDGKVLKINSSTNELYWDDVVFSQLQSSTGSALELFGNPVLNNYSLEFTDNRMCPTDFGELQFGDTFNSFSLVEMLKRVVYSYLPPGGNLSIRAPYNSGYVEVGTSPIPILDWEINKKTLDLNVTTLTNMIPGIYSPISSSQYVNVFGQSTGIVITPITASTTTFTMTISDTSNYILIKTASISGVYPYFSGFSSLNTMTVAGLPSLDKIIEPKSNKNINLIGSGNLYFIYPKIHGTLSNIYDSGGNDYLASGTFSGPSVGIFNSPEGLWSSTEFYVYKWSNTTINAPGQFFEFVY
jgi:hypothetical protein